MTKIRCNKCKLTFNNYFSSCHIRVCDNNLCNNSLHGRNDQLRKVNGRNAYHVVFQDAPKPGQHQGNQYLLKDQYSSDRYILERIGYQSGDVLVISVEFIKDVVTGKTEQSWLYVKPTMFSEWGEHTVSGVSPKPQQYTPCKD